MNTYRTSNSAVKGFLHCTSSTPHYMWESVSKFMLHTSNARFEAGRAMQRVYQANTLGYNTEMLKTNSPALS